MKDMLKMLFLNFKVRSIKSAAANGPVYAAGYSLVGIILFSICFNFINALYNFITM